ncbi:tetratricopeptide repeat-containing sensor histidine kinase [Seonamhaeicola aphaedonensis]|uniref:histidine kinase n=1 Tax=Seonamhaeicola aphaedonensis TaxID=1461338 RepID=A0A3D9HHG3_9FLAO|nr:tetratricopeptide repeat-containing sensor histidine kinase [Seonamhaeicola aphaedonensis]RED48396.1 signal transduction histidine kinase [Seonamhaeicola aphaedonensis]
MKQLITLGLILITFLGFSQTKEIDSLTIKLAYQKQDSLKVDTSLQLIKALYNLEDYNKASDYILLSEKLSDDINYKKGTAEVTYYKALIYAQKDDYINALRGYNKAKNLFKSLNDVIGVAKVNNNIGLIEIKRGNFSEGLQYSLAAINELEKQDLKEELKLAYSNLAKAYSNVNAHDKAIAFYIKALHVQEQLKDADGITTSNMALAELYSLKKEHRKAIEYYEKVLANNTDTSIRGTIYSNLGGEYLKFNDYNKATEYLVQAYNINIRSEDKSGLLTVLNNLADLNLRKSRLNVAERQLLQAGAIAKELDNKKELLKHYKLMTALDSTRRRFDRAFVWQREYYNLKNELDKKVSPLNDNTEAEIRLELDPNFDQLHSDSTTEDVKKNISTEDSNTLGKFKILLYALLAALAIVATFLILAYLKRNETIKYTQELEEKSIKTDLQKQAYEEQIAHLESINNVKDKLFSIVSHDLKDSLSSINGFIGLLSDGSLSREEFEKLIPELSENANNASLLLFNLLNWSKSQMQSLEPKPSLFDIQEVFEDKVKLVEQRLENKGITLIDHSLRDFAYADRSMFEIVVQNLLANAIKFCKEGDTITISNHISNGSSIVSIADTGVGISKENLGKLFKNTSFTTTGTSNEKGTGLGLSICKELVELNHGKIWVESTLNVGSTFYVQLPKSKPTNA